MTVAVVTSQGCPELAAQTRTPDDVVTGPGALQRAYASGARWLWLLRAGSVPRPDALARLLAAPEAVIVTGATLDERGRIRTSALPAFAVSAEDVIALAGEGFLPIRHTPLGHCLVRREAFDRHGFPDPDRFGSYADAEWSARVLSAAPGLFAARSIVAGAAPAHPSLREGRSFVRMMRTGAWSRGDRVAALAAALGRRAPQR